MTASNPLTRCPPRRSPLRRSPADLRRRARQSRELGSNRGDRSGSSRPGRTNSKAAVVTTTSVARRTDSAHATCIGGWWNALRPTSRGVPTKATGRASPPSHSPQIRDSAHWVTHARVGSRSRVEPSRRSSRITPCPAGVPREDQPPVCELRLGARRPGTAPPDLPVLLDRCWSEEVNRLGSDSLMIVRSAWPYCLCSGPVV